MVRTDLDALDLSVILALVKHGYEVAAKTMAIHEEGLKSRFSARPWEPASTKLDLTSVKLSKADQEDILKKAKRRRIRLLKANDPIWLIAGAVGIAFVMLCFVLLAQLQDF